MSFSCHLYHLFQVSGHKPEREIQIPYDSTYMWNQNYEYDTNKLIYETERDPQTEKTKHDSQGEKRVQRDKSRSLVLAVLTTVVIK